MKMLDTIVIGQGGGPTGVINDTLAGLLYAAQKDGCKRVLGLRNGVEGGGLNPEIPGNIVNLTRKNPFFIRGIPGDYLGTNRLKLDPREDIDKIARFIRTLKSKRTACFVYIGGNDSADTARVVAEHGVRVIHIEKTIDNDLCENDHTSGYSSTCVANANNVKRLSPDLGGFSPRVRRRGKDVYSVGGVAVYRTQGRAAGWLTLGCGFAKVNHAGDVIEDAAPHVFVTAEGRYDSSKVLDAVDNDLRKRGFVFIACGEGLRDTDGKSLAEKNGFEHRKDKFGNVEHSRAGSFDDAEFIALEIQKALNIKVGVEYGCLQDKITALSPQHIPRGWRTQVDAQEAFAAGVYAYEMFRQGKVNVSIALKRRGTGYIIEPDCAPLEFVAGKTREVDAKYLGGIRGPSAQFYHDFLPAIGGPLTLDQFERERD